MLLSKTVEIKVLNNNKSYLENLGYDTSKDKVNILVEHLSKFSRVEVTAICSVCEKTTNIKYLNYFKSIENGGFYTCSGKCSNIKRIVSNRDKFGSDWASQNNDIKEKVKKTNLDKYGVEYLFYDEEFKNKIKDINLQKWGTEYTFQSPEIRSKIEKTNLEKWGCLYPLSNNDIKKKIKETNLKKFGVENPMQSIDIQNISKKTKLEKYVDENFNNRNKAISTNLERYGVEHYSKTDEFIDKSISTNLEKYGVEHYSKTEEFKKSVKKTKLEKYNNENFNNLNKIYSTNLEKYGFKSILESPEFRLKIKNTNLEKYGVENYIELDKVKEKRVESFNKKNKQYVIETYSRIIPNGYKIKNYDSGQLFIEHNDHEFVASTGLIYDRLKYSPNIELCTKCCPLYSAQSSGENEISNWIKSLGLIVETKNRKILNNSELDIYLPDFNIAIEFNGLYWHSELFKDKNYHLNKTTECKSLGIKLIHVFEDDWNLRKEIVKSIILNALNKSNIRIFARKCEIREIETKQCRDFLNKNHIQGYSNSKYKLGLFYQNELVSVMTFGLRKTNRKKEFELIRFCNKIEHNIIGSASKLFKFFIKNYEYKNIVSYADISIFSGDLYEKLGFKFIHLSSPNFYWVLNGEKHHRFKFNKRKLIKMGFDKNETGLSIMKKLGAYRIFSCGQLRYEFNIDI